MTMYTSTPEDIVYLFLREKIIAVAGILCIKDSRLRNVFIIGLRWLVDLRCCV